MNQTKQITTTPPHYVYPEIAVDEVTVESGFAASIEYIFKYDEYVPW